MSDPIPPNARARIEADLKKVEAEHGVRILFAVESGSRAWGFPSQDSDYDVRFVYVRPSDDYLSIQPVRDVIELPIDGLFDTNGWDVKKALGLLLKANPVLFEWLSSPIRYRWNTDAVEAVLGLSRKVATRKASLHHYLNLANSQWNAHLEGRENVRAKKYFYAARPALAIRWMRLHSSGHPPMNFAELRDGTDLSAELNAELEELLRLKSAMREGETIARRAGVDALILGELEWAREAVKRIDRSQALNVSEADKVLRYIVQHFGPRS